MHKQVIKIDDFNAAATAFVTAEHERLDRVKDYITDLTIANKLVGAWVTLTHVADNIYVIEGYSWNVNDYIEALDASKWSWLGRRKAS